MSKPNVSLAEKLQSCPRWVLYLLLVLTTSIPLFISVPIPNKPQPFAVDFYRSVMAIPDGKTVLLASDWTKSTRGESAGSFKGLIRILMRKNLKFALYSTGDAQAPGVAEGVIREVNKERVARGEEPYRRFEDWVMIGFLPNSEGIHSGFATNFRSVVDKMRDSSEGSTPRPVLESGPLKDIKTVADFGMLINVTGSKTSDIIVERLYGKVPLAVMVTGVMAPEVLNYYPKQVAGVIGGLKGVYDLEQMMEHGLNNGEVPNLEVGGDAVPGFKGQPNTSTGTAYYGALHVSITLLILAVLIGNVGMFLARKGGKA